MQKFQFLRFYVKSPKIADYPSKSSFLAPYNFYLRPKDAGIFFVKIEKIKKSHFWTFWKKWKIVDTKNFKTKMVKKPRSKSAISDPETHDFRLRKRFVQKLDRKSALFFADSCFMFLGFSEKHPRLLAKSEKVTYFFTFKKWLIFDFKIDPKIDR